MAVAALADALAANGVPPSVMISELRSELIENAPPDRDVQEAALTRLELELCHGPPRDKCVKCRQAPRTAQMVHCGHEVLCASCLSAVQAHVGDRPGMSQRKLCRLLCPFCRGLETEEGPTADRLFSIIDTNQSGTIEPAELLIHLLVAGQEPETVADLCAPHHGLVQLTPHRPDPGPANLTLGLNHTPTIHTSTPRLTPTARITAKT